MKDSVILGTGNSRYLKSVADFKSLYPTYDDFASALVAGTLPVDFNGINTAGFQQVGDGLGSDTLLKVATAALFGLGTDAVPDDVLKEIKNLLNSVSSRIDTVSASAESKAQIATGSYYGTGAYGEDNPSKLTLPFVPKMLIIRLGSGRNTLMCNENFIWTGGQTIYAHTNDTANGTHFSVSGTTISWYANSYDAQMNSARATEGNHYYWVAIGQGE